MGRSRLLFIASSLALVIALLLAGLGAADARDDQAVADEDSLAKHLAIFTEVLGLVRHAYVEAPQDEALMAGAMDGTTDALDPFSVYVPPSGVEAYTAARDVGTRYSGLMLLRERGFVYVVGVSPGSPAAEADVRLGDIVTDLDGRNTRLLPMWEIQRILTQPPGTQVQVKLLRGQQSVEAALALRSFNQLPVSYQELHGAGLLRPYQIDPDTASQVSALLAQAATAGQNHLLLDLRGLAGGDMAAAYRVAALFAEGPLGTLRSRKGELESFTGTTPRWQGRLVVLVDRGTLGAAEILATVLRQKLEVELVGERTFGYAGRLKKVRIPSGGDLWLTDAFYTGPDGTPVNESLTPDLAVVATVRPQEGDEPVEDEILKRGLQRLLGEPVEEEAVLPTAA